MTKEFNDNLLDVDSPRTDSANTNPSTVGRVNRRQNFTEIVEPKDWWTVSRRKVIIGGAAATGVLLAGGGAWLALRDETSDVDQDSLALQQSQGWNVGSESATINLPSPQTLDSQQSARWREFLNPAAMLSVYEGNGSAWMPYFVPTLIQSLQSESLRSQMMPIFTPDMLAAYGRGQAIASDFLSNAQNPNETAIIVDLPGRESIAFGAGLASAARLVTTFDNFPHPLGVTPSQETLAAMLYYTGEIQAKQSALSSDAPPAFLLDSNRLADYKDADAQFDNRYLAKLPSVDKLKERGVKSILYITPDRTRAEELDDLNDDFVAYKNGGLNVAMLPASDLTLGDGDVARNTGGDINANNNGERRYYYGGNPMFLPFFFYSYPFYSPRGAYGRGSFSNASTTGGVRPPVTPPRYAPAPRPTMFSSTRIGGATAGVGRSKPSGFGRSTVRVASSGRVVGTRAGRSGFYSPSRTSSFGRSGSLGRGGSSGG